MIVRQTILRRARARSAKRENSCADPYGKILRMKQLSWVRTVGVAGVRVKSRRRSAGTPVRPITKACSAGRS